MHLDPGLPRCDVLLPDTLSGGLQALRVLVEALYLVVPSHPVASLSFSVFSGWISVFIPIRVSRFERGI